MEKRQRRTIIKLNLLKSKITCSLTTLKLVLVRGHERGEEGLDWHFVKEDVGWNVSREVVAFEVKGTEIGEVREGGWEYRQPIVLKVEIG